MMVQWYTYFNYIFLITLHTCFGDSKTLDDFYLYIYTNGYQELNRTNH